MEKIEKIVITMIPEAFNMRYGNVRLVVCVTSKYTEYFETTINDPS